MTLTKADYNNPVSNYFVIFFYLRMKYLNKFTGLPIFRENNRPFLGQRSDGVIQHRLSICRIPGETRISLSEYQNMYFET